MSERRWKDRDLNNKFAIGTLVGLRPDRKLYNTITLEEDWRDGKTRTFSITSSMVGMIVNYVDDSLSAEVMLEGHVVLVGPGVMQVVDDDQA
jgi:hypothetical protein